MRLSFVLFLLLPFLFIVACTCFFFLPLSLPGDDIFSWLLFLSVFSFCLISVLFFVRPRSRFDLVWFRVTTAGFVADQLKK